MLRIISRQANFSVATYVVQYVVLLYYWDCTTHRSIEYLRMCNTMYALQQIIIIFAFIQVPASVSR